MELGKTTLYWLIHLFYWRRVSSTTLYALSSHLIICRNFLLQAYFLQVSLKLTWANSKWQYLKNCKWNNKTIVIILRPCKAFEQVYINQISIVAKTSHSYLIQVCHCLGNLSLAIRTRLEHNINKSLPFCKLVIFSVLKIKCI